MRFIILIILSSFLLFSCSTTTTVDEELNTITTTTKSGDFELTLEKDYEEQECEDDSISCMFCLLGSIRHLLREIIRGL